MSIRTSADLNVEARHERTKSLSVILRIGAAIVYQLELIREDLLSMRANAAISTHEPRTQPQEMNDGK